MIMLIKKRFFFFFCLLILCSVVPSELAGLRLEEQGKSRVRTGRFLVSKTPTLPLVPL